MDHCEAQPAPFDPKNWISIPDAMALAQSRKRGENSTMRRVRKSIIGALVHERDSRLEAIAAEYREGFDRIESEPPTIFRGAIEIGKIVPCDFWRIGLAWDESADHAFATGTFSIDQIVPQAALPFRLRDKEADPTERVRLWQVARGVHLSRAVFEALVDDRQFFQWGNIADAGKIRKGAAQRWKWHEALAALTFEASQNPQILRDGTGPIIAFLNDEMRRLHFDQVPDGAEVWRVAQAFAQIPPPDEEVLPPD